MTVTVSVGERLAGSPVYRAFVGHPFFVGVDSVELSRGQAALLIGQWWHPLHYFPTFLARCVAVLPGIGSKSAITRILNQEVGGGVVARAHEVVFVKSMEECGFDAEGVTGAVPYAETAALVAGYEVASGRWESGLGFIFATETTDLLMVSSVGKVVARATGVRDNKWVRIHVAQEPDHVDQAKQALVSDLSVEQQDVVVAAAEQMWRLWSAFFDRLVVESGVGAIAVTTYR